MECCNAECLERIHALELKIALEIKRICEKYDIAYFLTAGTLLGAVRHSGFIPWDDDMDIGMLRSDYERFLKACELELGEEFFLQTWDTDEEYPFSYGKIRLKGTRMVETFAQGALSENDGLFVDIFPFDNVPDNTAERKVQAVKYYLCKRLLWIKKGMGTDMKNGSLKKRIKYYSFKAFSYLFKYEDIKAYYRKNQVKYNGRETQCVVTDGAYSFKKESLQREWVTNLDYVEFEGIKFLSYKNKKEYLEYFYGDYMKLPPEDKRGGHNLVRVDFGDYK